jgi:outer membrane protein OmpA-like peptidoglycan-associated protein
MYSMIIVFLVLVMFPSRAEESDQGHLLVSPYEGSKLLRKTVQEFDEYNAFMGMNTFNRTPMGLKISGKITKLYFSHPKKRSILEIFKNYQLALEQNGAQILYQCNQKEYECAREFAGPTMQKFSGINSMANLVGRYLLAKIEKSNQAAYVAVAVGEQFSDVHVIEITDMESGKVTLDANALGNGLDANGYVIVNGLYFDTDKATLKPDSNEAVTQVAELLKTRPELSIYIVGHTDMQGEFEHNLKLSQDRAVSIMDILSETYQIDKNRMEAKGLGPLSPQASNDNEDGRSLNRRVVIVAR